MTLLHFINCIGLAAAPYILLYRYSGLLELGAYWRCLKAGGAYVITQFIKLMLLATFYPVTEVPGSFNYTTEFIKCSIQYLDYLGIYIVLTKVSPKGEMKITATAVGWGLTELVSTKLLPYWFGARGTEFNWQYIQSSIGVNINLVYLLVVCALLWIWTRHNTDDTTLAIAAIMLTAITYTPALLHTAVHLGIGTWLVVAINAVTATILGIIALVLYIKVNN